MGSGNFSRRLAEKQPQEASRKQIDAISLVVKGITVDSLSWKALADELGSNVRLLPQGGSCGVDLNCSLALGVYTHGSERERAFDVWARASGIPALSVRIGKDELVVGPL